MKECIKCRRELADDAVFCSVCGTKQEENPLPSNYETRQETNDYQPVQQNFSDNSGNDRNLMASSKMTFFEAVKTCFLNYANFNGRARRREYWYFCWFSGIIAIIILLIGGFQHNILFRLYQLAIATPSAAVCWRRFHDIGKSGKYAFIGLIPIVGWIMCIVWMAQDSQPGTNQYGQNPKGIN